jgi:uncharacterized membrane protein YdbT with pleckstrin-like domain
VQNLTPADEAAIYAIERPHRDLLPCSLLQLLAIPPLFPFLAPLAYFRYRTLRYRFTEEGISMSWGVLFRREVIVNYARIQDIHLRSNFVERWFGLARVLVQTASGNSGAEMTIEGLKEYAAVRDFLYARMRGVRDDRVPGSAARPRPAEAETRVVEGHAPVAVNGELAATLREVAAELRAVRAALTERATAGERRGGDA